MKNKLNHGNTLPIVLIVLIVASIIALGITYVVATTSNYRVKKSTQDINYIILGNEAYDVINDANDYYLLNGTLIGYTASNDKIKDSNLTDNEMHFKIVNEELKLEIQIIVIYDSSGYQIFKWDEK